METALPFESVKFDLSVEQTGDISSMNAEEYLSWVRYQANKLPGVKRVDIKDLNISNRQSQYMPQIENILTCSIQLLPSDEWKNELLYNFSEIRMQLEDRSHNDLSSKKSRKLMVPAMKDEASWYRFCLACECNEDSKDNIVDSITDNSKDNITDILNNCNNNSNDQQLDINAMNSNIDNDVDINDNLQIISKRKRKLANQLGIVLNSKNEFEHEEMDDFNINNDDDRIYVEEESDICSEDAIDIAIEEAKEVQRVADLWQEPINVIPSADVLLQFDQVLTQRLLNLHINWLENSILSIKRGQWLYGLLARLEKPLYRETVASIRQLYRRCCYLRYHLVPQDYIFEGQELSDQLTSELAILNTIIAITGDYFGQSDDYFDEINDDDNNNMKDNNNKDDNNSDKDDDNNEDEDNMEDIESDDDDDEEEDEEDGMYMNIEECDEDLNNYKQEEELEDGEEFEIQTKRIKK